MSYVAAVLTPQSREALLNLVGEIIPNHFEEISHHLTVHMGQKQPYDKIGRKVQIIIDKIAISKTIIAVSADPENLIGFTSNNSIPHITVALDRAAGARPVHSNLLKDWTPLDDHFDEKTIVLDAVIQECQ